MKKRLLITSIVMMLVVAVALGTSTYAWFTSNTKVEASTVSLTAATNGANALGIGWKNGTAGPSIEANSGGILLPMAPATLTDGETLSNVAFNTSTIKQVADVNVFNTASTGTDPVIYGNGTVGVFYVKNLSPQNSIDSITITPAFTANYAYVLTADTTFDGSKTYYTLANNVFTAQTSLSGAVPESPAYYEKVTTGVLDGTDLMRVAIFTKEYRAASGTYASGTYYEYNSATDSFVEKTGLVANESSLTGLYALDANYTLLGVLGKNETSFKQVTKNSDAADDVAYDKNTTYYTKSGDVYTQVSIAAYDSETTYYTAANTAVYGTWSAGNAVKDLSHYTHVQETLTLSPEALLPGEVIEIVAVVWLDGTELDDTKQGYSANVSLSFE